jgi:hypothetical protein
MNKILSGRARLPVLAAALALAASLAACHHNDDDNHGMTPGGPGTGTTNPPAVTDAFFSYVAQVVATLNEADEPASTDGVAVTAPDNTEPQALPAS